MQTITDSPGKLTMYRCVEQQCPACWFNTDITVRQAEADGDGLCPGCFIEQRFQIANARPEAILTAGQAEE